MTDGEKGVKGILTRWMLRIGFLLILLPSIYLIVRFPHPFAGGLFAAIPPALCVLGLMLISNGMLFSKNRLKPLFLLFQMLLIVLMFWFVLITLIFYEGPELPAFMRK